MILSSYGTDASPTSILTSAGNVLTTAGSILTGQSAQQQPYYVAPPPEDFYGVPKTVAMVGAGVLLLGVVAYGVSRMGKKRR